MQESPELASDFRLNDCLYLSALLLLYYDHFLTSGLEVSLIWVRPFGISSFLFCLNRYFLSLGNVVVAYSFFSSVPSSVCRHLSLYRELLFGIAQLIVCVILSLRIYAIYARSRRILVSLSCVLTVFVVVALITNLYDPTQTGKCQITNVGVVRATRTATFWEVVFVYDVVIFSLFVRRALQLRKEAGHRSHCFDGPPTILEILIRDGFIYFIVMALANLINIFFIYFSDLRSALFGLTSSISITMMSRMILNLHQTADEGLYSTISFSPSFDILTSVEHSNDDTEEYRNPWVASKWDANGL